MKEKIKAILLQQLDKLQEYSNQNLMPDEACRITETIIKVSEMLAAYEDC